MAFYNVAVKEKLNIIPGYAAPVYVKCSQYDGDLTNVMEFTMYNGNDVWVIPTNITKIVISGMKKDMTGFSYYCTQQGSVVRAPIMRQMTVYSGLVPCNICFFDSNDNQINSAAFILDVEKAGLQNNVIQSSNDFQTLKEYLDVSKYYSILSQSYAVGDTGIRTGEDEDNSKYYANLARLYKGSPLVADTVSAMEDESRVYVYTGSETDYTSGNWYYWDGSAWTSGGVYNAAAVQTDNTLAIEDMAADSKAVGDAITKSKGDLKENISLGVDNPEIQCLLREHRRVIETSGDVELTGVYRFAGPEYYSSYYNIQGGCYYPVNDSFIIAIVDETFTNGILVELDEDFEVLRRSSPIPIGHGNDMDYNPNTGMIAVAPGTDGPNATKVVIVDPTDFTVNDVLDLGHTVWEISYDTVNNIYYCLNGTDLYQYDDNFERISHIVIDYGFEEDGKRLMKQASFVYKEVFYVQTFSECMYNGSPYGGFRSIYINSFGEDGKTKSAAKYRLKDAGDEPEAMCVKGDHLYIFSGHLWTSISKMYLNNLAIVEKESDYYYCGNVIMPNSDLNDYVFPGKYYSPNATISGGLTNCPWNYSGFNLDVITESSANIYQVITTNTGRSWKRVYDVAPASWTAWKAVLSTSGLSSSNFTMSIPSGVSTIIGSVELEIRSMSVIVTTVEFPSNSTGKRQVSINGVWVANSQAISNDSTRITGVRIIDRLISGTAPVNIRVFQDSGSAMNVTAQVDVLTM